MERIEMEPVQTNSYWDAAGKAGAIVGFVVFLISLIGNYMTIMSAPTGSFFNGSMVASTVGCLTGALGGIVAVKFYMNEFGSNLKIGKGAVIGLVTGIFIALIYQILSLVWPIIDSSYLENLQMSMIANFEMMNQIPADQQEQMIDAIYAQMQNYYSAASILQNLFFGILSYGLLNVLSGLIGAKIMGDSQNEMRD